MAETVWLVTMSAVYDHGCCGIFRSREAAVSHAEALLEDSDGHHDFRVEPVALDVAIDIDGRGPFGRKRPKKGGRVLVDDPLDSGEEREEAGDG